MKNKVRLEVGISLVIIYLALLSFIVIAASFDFDPTPPVTFNLSEDVAWLYDVNITVNENLVNFSIEENPYQNLSIDKDNGIMRFTPTNDKVGISEYYLIIVKNLSNPASDYITTPVRFNISNTNDAPNITSYYPTINITSVNENSSIYFNVTADDIDIQHGDFLNYTWFLDGVKKNTSTNWTYSPGFCDAGNYNVTVIVNDSENAFDSHYWNLTVNNTNRAAVFNRTIQNITWVEDSNLTNNITLSEHFYDLDYNECNGTNNDTLTYSAIGNSSIRIIINSSSYEVSFIPDADFSGVEYVLFSLNDSHNITYSNNITLNVTNVNDAPVLSDISNQTLYVSAYFSLQVNATDADNDTLTYYDNTTLFNINSTAGLINLTPNASDIGNYSVNITVGDGYVNDSQIVLFSVLNNSAPVLASIGNLNATEGTLFFYDVNATDADNDILTFYTNATFFSINSTNGTINFTPVQNDVGNHSVKISVNDSKGAVDFEIINFTVSGVNHQPNLTLIPNQTMRIDKLFTLYVHASDSDGDSLSFYDNATIFNISNYNSTAGLINFTPLTGDIGVHMVNITVSDGTLNDSQIVQFNITNNTAPVLDAISNQSLTANQLFTLYVTAVDQDNDNMSFSDNATIFNISNYNSTAGLINFTPNSDDNGTHIINISVSDGNLSDCQLVWFNISQNYAPNITSYYPISTNVSVVEGSSLKFNVSVSDADNDTITYNWTLNGTPQSTSFSWLYQPNYTSAGNYNVTVVVSDGKLTDSHYWNLTVNNINRAPNFGIIIHTTEANFSSGTNNNTNTTLQSGNVTLAMINSTHYNSTGNFTSSVIVIPVDYFDNVLLGNISWTKTEPANTSIIIKVKTSSNNSVWSNWSVYINSSGQQIQHDSGSRYVQYLAEFLTNNTNTTPVLEDVTIRYKIPDFIGNEDVQYSNWIDLDDYFSDDDGDTISYNVTSVDNVAVSIDSSNEVTVTPTSDWYGTVYVVFTANDAMNITESNNVTITFNDVSEPSSPVASTSGGGGGGGAIIIQKKRELINITQLFSLELIVPKSLSVISNKTIIAEIFLKNRGNVTLKDIYLKSFVNTPDIITKFSKDYFKELKPGQKEETELIINIGQIKGSHNVIVKAEVTEPSFNDTVVIQLNFLENLTTKLYVVMDLLKTHPECLELTEAVQKAQESIRNSQYEQAELLLNSVVEGCKYLISSPEIKKEMPEKIMWKFLRRILLNKELSFTAVFIILTMTSLIIYIWHHSRKEI